MILDKLTNASRYRALGGRLAAGLEAIPQFLNKEPGLYEIDGNKLFVMVQCYTTKPLQGSPWETHRRYIDIQYVHSGVENIGFSEVSGLKPEVPYNQEEDCELFSGDGVMLPLPAGSFAVFFANEAHMPRIIKDTPVEVYKLVIKVAVE